MKTIDRLRELEAKAIGTRGEAWRYSGLLTTEVANYTRAAVAALPALLADEEAK